MNTIICPNCKKEVEITQALRHRIEDDVRKEEQVKHLEEIDKVKKTAEEKAAKKIAEEFELRLRDKENETKEKEEKNKRLNDEVLDYAKRLRLLQDKDREREAEMQKKLIADREKMQEEISKQEHEKSKFEKLQLQKQLDDTKRALEEAQRKAQQSSQQLQGEVLELEVEKMLTAAFPHDDITAVSKGAFGADITHVVKSPKGYTCGTVLWEIKRTKDWSDKWITKLKDDLRTSGANIPVIVSIELPKEAKDGFGLKEGVFICSFQLVLPIAAILRKNLLDVGYQKAVSANKDSKADLLYSYITGHEFQNQIEIFVEVYKESILQVQKERAAFERSWKQREAQAQRIITSAANIVGSMQGRIGASMLQIKGLELDEADGIGQIELLDGKDTSRKTDI